MITLSQGTSIKVQLPNGGEIDMTSTVGSLSPILAAPTIATLIRNTTGQVSGGGTNQSMIFRFATKPNDTIYIEYDASQNKHIMKQDPRTLPFKDGQEYVVRLNPKLVGEKYRVLEWDSQMNTVGNVLGMYVSSWVNVRRIRKQLEVFTLLDTAVKNIQENNATSFKTATKFEEGAHYIQATYTNDEAGAEKIYNDLGEARNLMLKLGLPSAPSADNQTYFHTEGMDVTDPIMILNPKVEMTLKRLKYVLASIPGYEAYTKFGLVGLLGVAAYVTAVLPSNWNFVVLTTGLQGTIALEQIGSGMGGLVYQDPEIAPLGYRLNLWDQYIIGVVLPFQALISQTGAVTPKVTQIPQKLQKKLHKIK